MYLRKEESLAHSTCNDVDLNGDGVLETVVKQPFTKVRIQDVLDGTSKTIAIGEAAYFTDLINMPLWAGTWAEDGTILFKTTAIINCGLGGPRLFPFLRTI